MLEISDFVALVDARFAWLAAAAALAGLVRGFSGFGAAMIFIPVASAAYEPRIAVVLLFVFDVVVTAPLLIPAFRRCTWREVVPLLIGATVAVPIGVRLLIIADPLVLRWLISIAVLGIVAAMALGWRTQRRPSVAATVGIGGLAGLAGGIASLYGPPVILLWLGGRSRAPVVRANIFAFFGLVSVVGGLTLWLNGLFHADLVRIAIMLMPIYGATILLGTSVFGMATERQYRAVAVTLCAAIAVGALPVWEWL